MTKSAYSQRQVSRRAFLTSCTTLGGAAYVAAKGRASVKPRIMLLGYGARGRRAAYMLKKHGISPAVVVGNTAMESVRAANETVAVVCPTVDIALQSQCVDAVIIATAHIEPEAGILRALKAGKAVYCPLPHMLSRETLVTIERLAARVKQPVQLPPLPQENGGWGVPDKKQLEQQLGALTWINSIDRYPESSLVDAPFEGWEGAPVMQAHFAQLAPPIALLPLGNLRSISSLGDSLGSTRDALPDSLTTTCTYDSGATLVVTSSVAPAHCQGRRVTLQGKQGRWEMDAETASALQGNAAPGDAAGVETVLTDSPMINWLNALQGAVQCVYAPSQLLLVQAALQSSLKAYEEKHTLYFMPA